MTTNSEYSERGVLSVLRTLSIHRRRIMLSTPSAR
jgi:hypothetical protein